MSPTKRALLWLMAAFYLANGLYHFINPEAYQRIMPDFVPWPLAVVYISGIAEVLLGVGVIVPATRLVAAWGLVVLLVVIFPANVNVAVNDLAFVGEEPNSLLNWLRLPIQAVLIAWAWWYTRPEGAGEGSPSGLSA
ncbi:MAG: DoxX family protein [Acidobacteria bacterium]|nr:DoxX family protein [Acidobacteriota bacterium]